MIYRCRVCLNEEARGCLPTATCGLYGLFLLALSVGCIAAAASVLLARSGGWPEPSHPADLPWWLIVAALAVGAVLVVIGMVIINYLFEFVEYVVFVRRLCPSFGARRWSWGFTRGLDYDTVTRVPQAVERTFDSMRNL